MNGLKKAGVVIDRFGMEVSLVPDGDSHFTAAVDLVVSPPLWGWLFGLGPGVEVLGPDWAAADFAARLEQAAALYRGRLSGCGEEKKTEEKPPEECREE